MCCACGVLGHLAPIHWCARLACCVARAVSWTNWLMFSGVPARCVLLTVRCPGPLDSCSPVCPPGVFGCACGVLDHFAPVHRCARMLCCVGCAVSLATWLLSTGVQARCVVPRLRCPKQFGSFSPVWSLGLLCRALCVRCCVCGARCGARTRSSGRRLFVAGMGRVPSGRALVNREGGCYVAGRGWVRCLARTRPSGRQLFVAGRVWVASGRALLHPEGGCSVAARGWVRCRARKRPFGRWVVLLGTSSRAVVSCMLCALSVFASASGRCCLPPVRVPWLWRAAYLSGVPRGRAWCAAPCPEFVAQFVLVFACLPICVLREHDSGPMDDAVHSPPTPVDPLVIEGPVLYVLDVHLWSQYVGGDSL